MSALATPALAAHLRSGRFVQHEHAAANIPSRIRARRIACGSQFFGPRSKVAFSASPAAEPETATEKLRGWILNRLSTGGE